MTNAIGSSLKRFYRVELVASQPIHNGPSLLLQTNRSVNEQFLLTVTNTAIDNDIPLLPLTYVLAVTNLADGSVQTNATIDANGVITWTPTEVQGPSSNRLTTIVSDGSLKATNSFIVIVNEANSAPIAMNQGIVTLEDASTNLVLVAVDTDIPLNAFSYTILSGPTNGALSNLNPNTGTVIYVPSDNYCGQDAFNFTVSDGAMISTGAVNVVVVAVNDLPDAQDDTFEMGIGTTLAVGGPGVLANDTDAEGNSLSTMLVSGAAHGILSLNTNGGFSYTPTNYYVGTDSFTYRACDGLTNSGLAMATINVSYQLRILSITATNGMATVTWASISNQAYQLQYKDALEDSIWNDIMPGVLASGPITSITNAVGGSPKRFYRVRLGTSMPAPVIQSLSVSNGIATVTWSAAEGYGYRLQYKSNLTDAAWTDVLGDVSATGPMASKSDSVNGVSRKFYQVLMLP
jgi:hypothetical protein